MKETLPKPSKKEATIAKQKHYEGITDSIMFSIVEIKPDITFATSFISRFTKISSYQHNKVIKTILQYLKTTKDTGIMYAGEQGGDLIIKRYSDFNWTGNHNY